MPEPVGVRKQRRSPLDTDLDSVEQLIAQGSRRPPTRRLRELPAPIENAGDPHAMSRALREMREDGL
ncbi:MAG TPA: hypothetical protein VK904_02355 [Miltoncostaeaceae bacterium]|nr:hypothetical protein [Miltoncostaeaceae bacterium]